MFVPGRIEVLGKHTDYAGGSSLLVAVDRGFTFHAEPLHGDELVIAAEASGEEARWRVGVGGGGGARPLGAPRPPWGRYADNVLARLVDDGHGGALRGARIAFRSTLPVAAGLSSSSALVTGVFLALDAVCGISETAPFRAAIGDREALAGWLAAAEMGGPVGTRGGSEDHTAILCAREGRVVRYGLAPVRFRGSVPVPPGWIFAVAHSGVAADKGGAVRAHYNRLSDDAHGAARAWAASPSAPSGSDSGAGPARDSGARPPPPTLGAAAASAGSPVVLLDGIRRGASALGMEPEPLVRRAHHFLEECALVDRAFESLERGDLPGFGRAVDRSAEVGAELLGNQVAETLALTRLAREIGAPAASPFGAGFGGSVWALVPEAEAGSFLREWRERYTAAVGPASAAAFFTTPAAAPASAPTL